MKNLLKTFVMVLMATTVMGSVNLANASALTDSQKLELLQKVHASEAAFVPEPQMWFYTPKNGIYSVVGNVEQRYRNDMAIWQKWRDNDIKLHQEAREAGLI